MSIQSRPISRHRVLASRLKVLPVPGGLVVSECKTGLRFGFALLLAAVAFMIWFVRDQGVDLDLAGTIMLAGTTAAPLLVAWVFLIGPNTRWEFSSVDRTITIKSRLWPVGYWRRVWRFDDIADIQPSFLLQQTDAPATTLALPAAIIHAATILTGTDAIGAASTILIGRGTREIYGLSIIDHHGLNNIGLLSKDLISVLQAAYSGERSLQGDLDIAVPNRSLIIEVLSKSLEQADDTRPEDT